MNDWLAERSRALTVAPDASRDGHDPFSPYVETFWLPTLGPTSLAVARRLAMWLVVDRPIVVDLRDLAAYVGVGGAGKQSRVVRSLARCESFHLVGRNGDALTARTTFPWLTSTDRLPHGLRHPHALWVRDLRCAPERGSKPR